LKSGESGRGTGATPQQSTVGFDGRGFDGKGYKGFDIMGTQQSIGVGRVGRSVLNESFEVSTWKKSEAGGLMSLEGGGALEVDVINLLGFNGIDGD
jgi:hypothetical protein